MEERESESKKERAREREIAGKDVDSDKSIFAILGEDLWKNCIRPFDAKKYSWPKYLKPYFVFSINAARNLPHVTSIYRGTYDIRGTFDDG